MLVMINPNLHTSVDQELQGTHNTWHTHVAVVRDGWRKLAGLHILLYTQYSSGVLVEEEVPQQSYGRAAAL